ncbi:MAG: NADH-quinone oxidoreductase subunit NuoF [Oscillospiraceae bacterium]|jgi:NADH-quinone oxidoreductase subunit F|nr:NADH-quinone oxidoreductase subunit NuoF [Oscillospiraceae bacterium]
MRTKLNNRAEFQAVQAKYEAIHNSANRKILVCCGNGCVSSGSLKLYEEMKNAVEAAGLKCVVELMEEPEKDAVNVKKTGCIGFCEMGPLVKIEPEGWLYTKVQISDIPEIIESTIRNGEFVSRLAYRNAGILAKKQSEIPFYNKQTRRMLNYCGSIDCESIEDYIGVGGYSAAVKALFDMTPEQVVNEVTESGIRGRGGAGFPTGKKWAQVAANKAADVKYIVCNGDEGDPGAFMDGSTMEGTPHKVIEGMIIAGIGCEAEEAYIYVRAEYPLSVSRLGMAIEQATEMGLLGDNILGSGKNFHIHINQGAGAFVCGEGSAMTNSIEGNRGMPRAKLYHQVDVGLYGKPTCLNNVETFANVPDIINHGAAWFKSVGTEGSTGTKAFALTGNVNNTGIIEVPMGITLREVVVGIGGGIKNYQDFKAVQIGGPSGGCLTYEHLDLPLDFDSLKSVGAIIGSGGLVVMDENTCMVDTARFFMNFICKESCGKCTPCREGTTRMKQILENICDGEGTMEDLDELEEIARMMEKSSLCGLGKTAANPVLSTLANFRKEYEEHINEKQCRAGVCQKLSQKVYAINAATCIGCTKCARNCPVEAITGEIKTPHVIDASKCIKCGTCMEGCPAGAIYIENGRKGNVKY